MITKQNFFYILSYPRCRSTWFSQFLSTNVSHCYHEMLSGNEENAFFKHMFAIQRPFIGSADTNALSFARARRRTGPMVLIYRPEYDVIKSMLRAFDPHPGFSLEEWDQYIKNTTEMMGVVLNWYKEKEPNVLVIQFEELEDEETLMRIFKHCVPAYDPSLEYIKNLNNMRITLKRRQGLTQGIDQSCRNVGKTIEKFKHDHLEGYEKETFIKRVNTWKHETEKPKEPEYKHIIIPGTPTLQ